MGNFTYLNIFRVNVFPINDVFDHIKNLREWALKCEKPMGNDFGTVIQYPLIKTIKL